MRLISVNGAENDDRRVAPWRRRRTCSVLRTCARCSRVSAWSGAARGSCASMPRAVVPEHADIELSLVQPRAHAHPRHHAPGSAVSLRRRDGPHGGGRGLAVRQLAPAPRRESERRRSACTSSPTLRAARRSGSSWRRASQPNVTVRELRFDPSRNDVPLTERTLPPPGHAARRSRPAAASICAASSAAREDTPAVRGSSSRGTTGLLDGFCCDWRQLYALHGESEAGLAAYSAAARDLADRLRAARRRPRDAAPTASPRTRCSRGACSGTCCTCRAGNAAELASTGSRHRCRQARSASRARSSGQSSSSRRRVPAARCCSKHWP